jgi:hypothetical protein
MQGILIKNHGSRIFKRIGLANLVLVIPFIASFITNEVQWTPFDYAVASVLLSGFAVLLELGLLYTRPGIWRWMSIFLILLAFTLLYVELAVGIFGSAMAGS